jgi:hypothetical protein
VTEDRLLLLTDRWREALAFFHTLLADCCHESGAKASNGEDGVAGVGVGAKGSNWFAIVKKRRRKK